MRRAWTLHMVTAALLMALSIGAAQAEGWFLHPEGEVT